MTGLVERELSLSLADLRAMPSRTITAFLECSGNSRSRFPADPAKVEGTNWGNGAVGNAEWTGVSLRHVLEQAGRAGGRGRGRLAGRRFRPDAARAADRDRDEPDVLLAWQMNGRDLPAAHGGPVRLLVPGWGAIASTKWIIGLELIDYDFDGYYNADTYVLYDEAGAPTGRVTRMPVKSIITSPAAGSTVTCRDRRRSPGSHGPATAGSRGSRSSATAARPGTTPGSCRRPARISWVRFEHQWQAEPGESRLQSRATDTAGNIQPKQATGTPGATR